MSSVFITCAVTGSGDTVGKSDKVPVTPEQIATDCIEAAQAGAAIVHIHVRDPQTGAPSRSTEYYAEVVDRIRASDTDVVINLTAGMGGDLTLGSAEQPFPVDDAGTDMAGATERLDHVRRLLPEICTLDCGTMNFGEGDYVMTNTTATLHAMAAQIRDLGVVNLRGESGLVGAFLGSDLETEFGSEVGVSPLLVRFQGIRSNQPVEDPCSQEPGDDGAVVDFNTLTPWLNSPAELNTYWNTIFPDNPGVASAFRPNLIRAQIVLDHDAANFNLIESIVQLEIRSQPD